MAVDLLTSKENAQALQCCVNGPRLICQLDLLAKDLMVYLRQNHPDPICFNYGYDDKSFKEIQIQKSVGIPLKNPEDLPKAYMSKLPITWAKYKDLQDPCVT